MSGSEKKFMGKVWTTVFPSVAGIPFSFEWLAYFIVSTNTVY